MSKRLGLSPINADKMTVFLHAEEVITKTNLAMRVRKASIILDYTDHLIHLKIVTPDTEPSSFLVSDTRTKRSVFLVPPNAEHRLVIDDLIMRWDKHGAYPSLSMRKNKHQQKIAVFQLNFRDSKYIALTLMTTKRGTIKTDKDFMT